MNVNGLIGLKIDQTQGFLTDGTRVPISRVMVSPNIVTQIKSSDKEGYTALQVGFGTKKNATKALQGHSKKAGLETTPRFLREIRVEDTANSELGAALNVADIFTPGDIVDVTGTSKGKGYAGGVKRYHFRGGPRTHGQSDRERAPGSIGQTTTPGRVYKGKRMAGHMGVDTVTIKNLEVLDIVENMLLVRGLIPGPKGTMVMISKVGKQNKKYLPLYKDVVEEPTPETPESNSAAEEVAETTKSNSDNAEAPTQEADSTKPEQSTSESTVAKEESEAPVETVEKTSEASESSSKTVTPEETTKEEEKKEDKK